MQLTVPLKKIDTKLNLPKMNGYLNCNFQIQMFLVKKEMHKNETMQNNKSYPSIHYPNRLTSQDIITKNETDYNRNKNEKNYNKPFSHILKLTID